MYEKNSHCSYCGSPFGNGSPWPRNCRNCGNTSYVNPLPVVVLLVPIGAGLVAIRRSIEPRLGTVTLPGGYLDMGETWQEGAKRELLEETGIDIEVEGITLYDCMNGLDGTLIVFGLAPPQPESVLKPFSCDECDEVLLVDRPTELGFEMHTKVVARYFREKSAAAGLKQPQNPKGT